MMPLDNPTTAQVRGERWTPIWQTIVVGLMTFILVLSVVTYLHVSSELTLSTANHRHSTAQLTALIQENHTLTQADHRAVVTQLANQKVLIADLVNLTHQDTLTLQGLTTYAKYLDHAITLDSRAIAADSRAIAAEQRSLTVLLHK